MTSTSSPDRHTGTPPTQEAKPSPTNQNTAQPPAPGSVIGIDLGTTNSLAAAVFPHGAETLGTKDNGAIVPSVLCRRNGSWIVGQAAQALASEYPQQTVYSVKRLMGRDIQDLQLELKRLPYAIKPAQRGLVQVQIGKELFTPQELSAEILLGVKQRAEACLGTKVKKVVITVPAYFDDSQRQATRDAARLAGLEAVRILNEPTAAAIAYGLDQKKTGWLAVYDLGGGTFDVSILQLTKQVFRVIATHGDTHLGGDDFDALLADWFKEQIHQQHPQADTDSPLARRLLSHIAELVKIDLSNSDGTNWQIKLPHKSSSITAQGQITRSQFETLITPLVKRTLDSFQLALNVAKCKVEEIEEVVLVGGASRIPLVRKQVEIFCGKRPQLSIDPDTAIAIGAGIQANLLAGGRRDFLLLDVIPLSLGLETLGGAFNKLIAANTNIPAQAEELFTTQVENQTGVNINIYQGERELVKDCRKLGRFNLSGIPPMPAGLPKIRVRFLVDANGILTVSALEERSGQKSEIEVIPSHGLTQAEIDRMMEESFSHSQKDMQERLMIDFSNTAQAVLRGIEKSWHQAEKLLSKKDAEILRQQVQTVKDALQGTDPMLLRRALDTLGETTRPLADEIFSQAATKNLLS